VCQALEVKLQTSPTIDLGLVTPDSDGPAVTLSPRLRHSDARYLVAYGGHDVEVLRVEHIVVSTGTDFWCSGRCRGSHRSGGWMVSWLQQR
jgi:hypothetical protein